MATTTRRHDDTTTRRHRGPSIPPPLLALLCAAAMWGVADRWPVWQIIPPAWERVGWWIMDASAVAPILALVQFLRAGTTFNPLRPGYATELVTSGVYAWTRNPMYLGLSLLLCGWALRLGALSAFAGPVAFVPLIRYLQIRREELALLQLFGKQYEDYCRTVDRWFGRRGGALLKCATGSR